MARVDDVSNARTPEECLRLSRSAAETEARVAFAEEGLAATDRLESDTAVLLLRQLYLVHLEAHRFRAAVDVAKRMTRLGALADLAHHDASRALSALDELDAAIAEQRLAARAAPAERRSFHYWSLGALLHQAGQIDASLSALARAERWAHEDRPLIRAHRAWVGLDGGDPVSGLDAILTDLEGSRAARGYGAFVLGMLRHAMGDDAAAAVHLRALLRRNAMIDAAKAITLREELRRARATLASIESE